MPEKEFTKEEFIKCIENNDFSSIEGISQERFEELALEARQELHERDMDRLVRYEIKAVIDLFSK